MATINVIGSSVGTPLTSLLMCDAIEPGAQPSYQICKEIFLSHPLGAKMAASPIAMAQSQERTISIPDSPEEDVREAFEREWKAINATEIIRNVATQARVYGIASVAYGAKGVPTDRPIKPTSLADLELYFNVLDPLNTAGSLVLTQDPNSPDFQKHASIAVSGQAYHRSRACTILNGPPIYISYTTSAFGFVGRSVYQPALFPLKSFINTMLTDDMVAVKAGVIVAKMKQPGSIADKLMSGFQGLKRAVVKESVVGNVINITPDEDIVSLNLQNLEGPLGMARKHILENIAVAADMPAKIVNNETFAEGFGEGTEDAKKIAQYLDGIRRWMGELYAFFDNIVQYRAWNPDFYRIIQDKYPEFRKIGYTQAFYDWRNNFRATWPSLLTEPESEQIKIEETKLKALIAAAEVLLPEMDPENRAIVIQWVAANFNESHKLFSNPLMLDIDTLRAWTPPESVADLKEPEEPKPFSSAA